MEDNNNEYSYLIGDYSPDGKWCVTFEDNGETGNMYIHAVDKAGVHGEIFDDLWIYNQIMPPIHECKDVFVLWKDDSSKAGLIVDGECWGIYDLKSWRKINAPRNGNTIETLPLEVWERTLNEDEGETMKKYMP